MARLRLTIELEYDAEMMHGYDPDSINWFMDDILGGDHLSLRDSGDLGDEVGQVRVVGPIVIAEQGETR